MLEAAEIGATGMRAHQTQIDAIAHNVANVNTVGFRSSKVAFSEVSAALAAVVAPDTVGTALSGTLAKGAGTVAHAVLSAGAGELRKTDAPLDIAIDGLGFLEVVRADGTPAYTRAGSLQINADGFLVASDGSVLASRIAVPPDARAIRIAADGHVYARLDGNVDEAELGQIELVTFQNLAGLQAAGENQLIATAEAGAPQVSLPLQEGMGAIRQGYLESSNVKLTDELVALMVAQRAFEMNSKIVQAADQMMAITNGLTR